MTRLHDLQATMHRVLRGEAPVAEAAAALGCDERRLALYRDFVRNHVRAALEKNYPATRALLPEATWEALCEAYFREVPPRRWELNAAAEPFPAWLEARLDDPAAPEAGGTTPFHVELAQFEWERFATFVHPAEVPDPATLARPTLNPTATMLRFAYPVGAFVRAWNAGERPAPPAPLATPQHLFLLRHPRTGRVRYQVATDDLLFALKVVAEGLDAEAAARSIGQPPAAGRRALVYAAEVGLVLLPSSFSPAS